MRLRISRKDAKTAKKTK